MRKIISLILFALIPALCFPVTKEEVLNINPSIGFTDFEIISANGLKIRLNESSDSVLKKIGTNHKPEQSKINNIVDCMVLKLNNCILTFDAEYNNLIKIELLNSKLYLNSGIKIGDSFEDLRNKKKEMYELYYNDQGILSGVQYYIKTNPYEHYVQKYFINSDNIIHKIELLVDSFRYRKDNIESVLNVGEIIYKDFDITLSDITLNMNVSKDDLIKKDFVANKENIIKDEDVDIYLANDNRIKTIILKSNSYTTYRGITVGDHVSKIKSNYRDIDSRILYNTGKSFRIVYEFYAEYEGYNFILEYEINNSIIKKIYISYYL